MKKVGGLIDLLKHGQIIKRHSNPYIEEALQYENILFTEKEIRERSDVFNKLFSSNLIIEIGCYFGKTTAELAHLNPNYSILGLDITYKRVVKTARKIMQCDLKNAYVALCEAFFLFQNILQNESLDGVCIFFPDPWLKRREEKKRLLNEEFIALLFKKLKSGSFFWLKTDQVLYLDKIEFFLSKNGFIKTHNTLPKSLNFGTYDTEFQKIFTRKNISFFGCIYSKP